MVDEVVVCMDTLDNLLLQHNIQEADFLKIDVEGGELDVLKGARATIDRGVFGLQLEVRFMEFYKGAPLFSVVNDYVSKMGFELFDLNRYYYKS